MMNTIALIGSMLTVLTGAMLPGKEIVQLSSCNQVMIEEFLQGKMGDSILECPQGLSLPLKMIVKGDFLSLDSGEATPLYLKVLKTCYVRVEEEEKFLFSIDLEEWKEFSEFFQGNLTACFRIQGEGPIAGVEIELNQRNVQ